MQSSEPDEARDARDSGSRSALKTPAWLEALKEKGSAYNVQTRPDGQREIFRGNTPVVIPQKGHFDWDLRIAHMNQAKVDVSVVSLTCPNVYWGGEEVSVMVAREANDNVADAQTQHPDRIRWFDPETSEALR